MFNVKVAILDTDFYSLQAMTSFLAMDRRTRVIHTAERQGELLAFLKQCPLAEQPDVVILDADHVGATEALTVLLSRINELAPEATTICLAQATNPDLVYAAARSGARGYLLKGDLRLQISWAIIYTLSHDFVVTRSVRDAAAGLFNGSSKMVSVLPAPREYPELTQRIRQAIRLCVLEGMPAHLAADEMGISPHTVRSYIKEAYRILESYNELEFPVDMTAQERAFYRFTVPQGWQGSIAVA